MDYTENVFKYEVNLPETEENQLRALGVNLEDKSQPWIYQLLKNLDQNDNRATTEIDREVKRVDTPESRSGKRKEDIKITQIKQESRNDKERIVLNKNTEQNEAPSETDEYYQS